MSFTPINRSETDNLYRRAEPSVPRQSTTDGPSSNSRPSLQPLITPHSAAGHSLASKPLTGLHRRLSHGALSQPDMSPSTNQPPATNPIELPTRDPRRKSKSSKQSSPTHTPDPSSTSRDVSNHPSTGKQVPKPLPDLTQVQITLAELVQSAVVAGNAQYDVTSLENQNRQTSDDLDNATLTFSEQPGIIRHLEEKKSKLQSQIRLAKEVKDIHTKRCDHLVSSFLDRLLEVVNSSSSHPASLEPTPAPPPPPAPSPAIPAEVLNRIQKFEAEIHNLNGKNQQLSDKYASLTQKLLATPDEIVERIEKEQLATYQSKLEDAAKGIQALSTQLEAQDIAQQIEKVTKERQASETRLIKKMMESTSNIQEVLGDRLSKIIQDSEEKLVMGLRNESAKLTENIAEASKKHSLDLEEHVKRCDQLTNTHQNSIHTLEQISSKTVADLASIREATTEIRTQLNTLSIPQSTEDSSIKIKTEEDLATVKKTLHSITVRSDKNEHAITSLSARYNNITTEDLAKRMAAEVNLWRSKWEQHHHQLRAQVHNIASKVKDLEGRPSGSHVSTHPDLPREFEAIRNNLKTLHEHFTRTAADTERTIKTQKELVDELKGSQGALRETVHNTSMLNGTTATSLANHRLHADSELKALNLSVETQKTQIKSLVQTLNAYGLQLATVEKSTTDLGHSQAGTNAQMAETKSIAQEALDKNVELQKQTEEKLTEMKNAHKAQFKSLTQTLHGHGTQLKTMDRLTTDISEGQTAINAKLTEIQSATKEALDRNIELRAELDRELAVMKPALEKCKKGVEETGDCYDTFQEDVHELCEQLTDKYKEVVEKQQKYGVSIYQLSKDVEKIQKQLGIPLSAKAADLSRSGSQSTSTADGHAPDFPIAIEDSEEENDDDSAGGKQAAKGKEKTDRLDSIQNTLVKVQSQEANYLAEWKPTYGPGHQAQPNVEPVARAAATTTTLLQKTAAIPSRSSLKEASSQAKSTPKDATVHSKSSQKEPSIPAKSSQTEPTVQPKSSQKSGSVSTTSSQKLPTARATSYLNPATFPSSSSQPASVTKPVVKSYKRKHPIDTDEGIEDADDEILTPAMKRKAKKSN